MNTDEQNEKPEDLDAIEDFTEEGELIESESTSGEEIESLDQTTGVIKTGQSEIVASLPGGNGGEAENSGYYFHYVVLPALFLTVTLLGGMRVGIRDNEFIFLMPPLICLIFSVLMIVLFFRAGLIKASGWFREGFSGLKNVSNALILISLFFASAQIFNSLIPEQGLPFWIVAFCFVWTLWNNLFSEFDTGRLIKSLGALFGFAFVVKYLILANLVSSGKGNLLQRIWSSPTQEAFTFFLDLPGFGAATGYIQFFALGFYLLGLYFLRPDTSDM